MILIRLNNFPGMEHVLPRIIYSSMHANRVKRFAIARFHPRSTTPECPHMGRNARTWEGEVQEWVRRLSRYVRRLSRYVRGGHIVTSGGHIVTSGGHIVTSGGHIPARRIPARRARSAQAKHFQGKHFRAGTGSIRLRSPSPGQGAPGGSGETRAAQCIKIRRRRALGRRFKRPKSHFPDPAEMKHFRLAPRPCRNEAFPARSQTLHN